MKQALKSMYEFAFKTTTDSILTNLNEIQVSAKFAWTEQMRLSSICLWFIFLLMLVSVSAVGIIELVIYYVLSSIRGVFLMSVALIAELVSLLIKK